MVLRTSTDRVAANGLAQTIRDSKKLVNEAVHAAAERRPGSGSAALIAWVESHEPQAFFREVVKETVDAIELLLGAALDDACGLETLLRADREHTTALFVLERAIFEAVLKVRSLLDLSQGADRAVVRMVALHVHANEANLPAANAFGEAGAQDRVDVEGALTELYRVLKECGFQRRPHRTRPFQSTMLEFGGLREEVGFNVTQAQNKYMTMTPWHYKLSSGVAHAEPWMLHSLISTRLRAAPGAYETACIGAVGNVFAIVDVLADALEEFAGIDAHMFRKKLHQRRTALPGVREGGMPALGHEEFRTKSLIAPPPAPVLPYSLMSKDLLERLGKLPGNDDAPA